MRLWDQEAELSSAPLLGVPFCLFFSLGDTFFSGAGWPFSFIMSRPPGSWWDTWLFSHREGDSLPQ